MLSRLSIRHKLLLMTGIFLLPILLMSFLFVRQSLKDIHFGQKERLGVEALASAWPALLSAQDAVAGGQAGETFSKDQAALRKLVAEEADSLSAKMAEGHAAAAEGALGLINLIADRSNLTLDPDLDSYYLMDVTSFKAPDVLDGGSRLATQLDGEASAVERAVAAGRFHAAVQAQVASLDRAFSANPSLKAALQAPRDAFISAATALYNQAGSDATDPSQAYQLYHAMASADDQLWRATLTELDRLLAKRVTGFETQMYTLLAIAGFATLLAVAMALGLSRSIISAINGLDGNIRQLAEHDLDAEIAAMRRHDEIGQIARAIEVFRRATIDRIADASNDVRRNATVVKEKQRVNDLSRRIRDAINDVVSRVGTAAAAINESTERFSITAQDTRRDLATAITSLGASAEDVTRVSHGMNNVSAAFYDISAQTTLSARKTEEVTREIARSQDVAQSLNVAVGRIGEVSRLIHSISSQTNLLALNATIEAARAGDAGKGFAVVAGEVKSLATQTARATAEIEAQIQGVEEATRTMIAAVDHINGVISEVSQASGVVAGAVSTQSHAAQEIQGNLERAAVGNNAAVDVINTLPEATRRTEEAADRLRMISDEMAAMSQAAGQTLSNLLSEMIDKRGAARYASTEFLDVSAGDVTSKALRLLDISESGARIALMPGVKSGDAVVLHLYDADISATVVWVGRESFGVDLGETRLRQVQVMKLAA